MLKKRLGDDFAANELKEREIGDIFALDTEYMRTMNRYFECLDELEETWSQSNNSGLITEQYAIWELKDDILKGIASNLEVFSWVDFSKVML